MKTKYYRKHSGLPVRAIRGRAALRTTEENMVKDAVVCCLFVATRTARSSCVGVRQEQAFVVPPHSNRSKSGFRIYELFRGIRSLELVILRQSKQQLTHKRF